MTQHQFYKSFLTKKKIAFSFFLASFLTKKKNLRKIKKKKTFSLIDEITEFSY